MEPLLAAVGVILLSFGLLGLFGGAAPVLLYTHLGLGAILLGYAAVSRFGRLGELAGSSGARATSNVAVQTASLCAIAVLVAFLAARNPVNWDWTEAGLFTLTRATVDLLGSIPEGEQVEIYGFFQDGGEKVPAPGQPSAAADLLEMYTYASDRVRVRYLDPLEQPALAERFEVRSDAGLLLVCGGSCEQTPSPVRVLEFSEAEVTKALRSVLTEERRLRVLAGHGEAGLDDREAPGGFGQMRRLLENENYAVEELVLAGTAQVPPDTDALLVVGPDHSLFEAELDALDAYLRGGGAVAILADPLVITGIEDRVRAWGIELVPDIVVAEQPSLFSGPQLVLQLLVNEYGDHPITRKLGPRTVTVFPRARSVRAAEGAPVTPVELVRTAPAPTSWGETDTERFVADSAVALDPEVDHPGPVALAMATTVPGDDGAEGRLVVVGDSDFARNRYMAEAYNADLFLNMVAWLAGQEDMATIERKRPRASTAEISDVQFNTFRFLAIFVLPELVLLAGVASWWRRRG